MSRTGIGRAYVWNGCMLLIGRGTSATTEHAHHAVQIALTPEAGIRFRSAGVWREYRGAVIAPNHPHTFDGTGRQVANLFIEPESRDGRAILARFPGTGISPIPDDMLDAIVPPLFDAWAATHDAGAMSSAAQRVTRELAADPVLAREVDERVTRAVAYIKSRIDGPIALMDVAGAVHLSPGRFRHLFVDETGMTLRPYILWLRFQRAWELLSTGSSVSVAAHAAGFADAADLARTSPHVRGWELQARCRPVIGTPRNGVQALGRRL